MTALEDVEETRMFVALLRRAAGRVSQDCREVEIVNDAIVMAVENLSTRLGVAPFLGSLDDGLPLEAALDALTASAHSSSNL